MTKPLLATGMKDIVQLSADERAAISAYGARTTWPCGFTVYERGARADGVFIVLHGQVILRTQIGAGRTFVPWVATSGETFGAEGLEVGARYATAARAEEESETLHLSSTRFSALLREQPAHALALVRQLVAERTTLLEKFGQYATLTVEQRLVTALLRLARGDAPRRADGEPVVVPRRLLGELVGATRESTSLVLGRLTAEGLIQRVGNGLVINDLAQLAARLQTPPTSTPIELYDERETRSVAL